MVRTRSSLRPLKIWRLWLSRMTTLSMFSQIWQAAQPSFLWSGRMEAAFAKSLGRAFRSHGRFGVQMENPSISVETRKTPPRWQLGKRAPMVQASRKLWKAAAPPRTFLQTATTYCQGILLWAADPESTCFRWPTGNALPLHLIWLRSNYIFLWTAKRFFMPLPHVERSDSIVSSGRMANLRGRPSQ